MNLVYAFDSDRFRLGSLCKRGHAWPGTNQSLRRLRSKGGQCVECQKITGRQYYDDNAESERVRRRNYKRQRRELLRQQGLTSSGNTPKNAWGAVPQSVSFELTPYFRSIRNAGRLPSVAALVMEAQRQYWQKNPEARKEHDKSWAQASWWLQYQINPDLRLYHREKSKRRKAANRGQTPVQISVAAIRRRFNEFGNCCAYCGQAGEMEIEHVIPISKEGPHDIGNIVPACSRCNTSKRSHDMEAWYRQQSFFSELRLRRIQRVVHPPDAFQLSLGLA